jgi:hypothetical protein
MEGDCIEVVFYIEEHSNEGLDRHYHEDCSESDRTTVTLMIIYVETFKTDVIILG